MRAFLPRYELRTPKNLPEVLELLAETDSDYRPFAGGTDIMVQLEQGRLTHSHWVDVLGCDDLRGIAGDPRFITIGAATSYSEIQAHPVLREDFPMLVEAANVTGAIAIQNRGTLGGNIANASPAADSAPALLAYDAQLELLSAQGFRRVALSHFYLGYKQTLLKKGEIISRILLPRPTYGKKSKTHWMFRKVGTRQAQAITKVGIAAWMQYDRKKILQARIAMASVAPIPKRLSEVENTLVHQPFSESTMAAALFRDISPIDDIRSTESYRRRVTSNLIRDFLSRSA